MNLRQSGEAMKKTAIKNLSGSLRLSVKFFAWGKIHPFSSNANIIQILFPRLCHRDRMVLDEVDEIPCNLVCKNADRKNNNERSDLKCL